MLELKIQEAEKERDLALAKQNQDNSGKNNPKIKEMENKLKNLRTELKQLQDQPRVKDYFLDYAFKKKTQNLFLIIYITQKAKRKRKIAASWRGKVSPITRNEKQSHWNEKTESSNDQKNERWCQGF